jgi:hypothetical protein
VRIARIRSGALDVYEPEYRRARSDAVDCVVGLAPLELVLHEVRPHGAQRSAHDEQDELLHQPTRRKSKVERMETSMETNRGEQRRTTRLREGAKVTVSSDK